MQKLLLAVFMMAGYALAAQKTEFSVQLQSGFFSFRGKDASKVSWINKYSSGFSSLDPRDWVYEDFGKKPGFSYSIEATIKRLTHKWLYGVGLAFESVQSKMDVNAVMKSQVALQNVSGTATLENHFININPYFGKRLIVKKIMIDFAGGFDLGFCMKSHEKRSVTSTPNSDISPEVHRSRPLDVRGRIQLTAYYKKLGLLLGYSSGMVNYYNRYFGDGQKKAFSRFLRTGISYRLK